MPRRGKRDHDASTEEAEEGAGFDMDFENILKQLKPKQDDVPKKKKKIETLCKSKADANADAVQAACRELEDRINELPGREVADEARQLLQEDAQRWTSVLSSVQELAMHYEEAVQAAQKAQEGQLKKQEAEFLQTLEEITAAYHAYKGRMEAQVDDLRGQLQKQATTIVHLLQPLV